MGDPRFRGDERCRDRDMPGRASGSCRCAALSSCASVATEAERRPDRSGCPAGGHLRHGPAFFANAEKLPPDRRCRAVRARARKPLTGQRYSRCPQNIHKENQRFIHRKFSCCGAICLRDSGSVASLSLPQRIARHRAGRKGLRVTWAGRSDFGPGRIARVNGAPVDHEGSSDAEGSLVSQGPERAATGLRTQVAVAVP